MYPSASRSDSEDTVSLGRRINDGYFESEDIGSLFPNPQPQRQAPSSHDPSNPFSDRLAASAPATQIQFNVNTRQRHRVPMQHDHWPPGYRDNPPSHLPVPSGPSRFPLAGIAAMPAPIITPLSTFRDSHQDNDLAQPIPSDLLPGDTSPGVWAPPQLASSDQGNQWSSSVPSNLHPESMGRVHAPPPTLTNHHELLPPPFIVPSQNPVFLNDLAQLQPALAEYRRNFPPPLLSMDGVTTLLPSEDDIPPQPLTTFKHPQTRSRKRVGPPGPFEWRFVEQSGQRHKKFETPSVSALPSYTKTCAHDGEAVSVIWYNAFSPGSQ
jgi:hypothetical protein